MKKLIAGLVLAGTVALGSAAPAQAIINPDSNAVYAKVCKVISRYPTADGVAGVLIGLKEVGYTDEQIVNIVVGAVKTVCPENIKAVQKFIDKYGS